MKHSNNFQRHVLFSICAYLLLVFLGAVNVQAATYYVSLSGSDSNSGTSSSPFKTFAKAVKPLKPGDTLYIRAGTWTQQLDLMRDNKSGTSSAYIKIAGYPGEKVTIRYADSITSGYGPIKARGNRGYFIFENLVLDGSVSTNNTHWQIRDGNHHFILRNLEIKNFKGNGLFIKANNVQVINCSIHHQIQYSTSRVYGIYFNGANGVIQGNKIYSNPGGGLTLYPGPISNLVVRGNAIYDNNSMANSNVGGILLWGSSSSIISNTQIYNNLVYRNATASTSGNASGIMIGPYTSGTKVWNNTSYKNKRYGVQIGHDTTTKNTVVQNNISYANGTGNYINVGSGTTYTNNLTTDPKFVSASSNNFQLQSSSPAANTGVTLSSVPNDYRNVARPKGAKHDIGGYENY
ncbi:MAG: right-handed parallel beta-helix repeat-containing protein [Nitrospira sp.]|nr:right-handed parallel beta-helix repeat-containing protein [Nitrospira sp.]MDH4355880.1 right-handed parallel beta-helix repeat-containing protein [Nitrospira sp.]MDH5317905.1 right-handed parallel beta-helix repeat-containing protein [Nitrospira sp.]